MFSAPFTPDEIRWAKDHIRDHGLDSARGLDNLSYTDLEEVDEDEEAEDVTDDGDSVDN